MAMTRNKRIVFGIIVITSLVMATCMGETLWGQSPLDSLRKASPALARFVPLPPTPASFVADVPSVLTPEAHAEIDARIRAAQDEHLGDIGAAILPSIGDFPPSEIALAIYRTWRIGRVADIGDAQRNLGVLILLVPKELTTTGRGECFILTGRGSEGVLTDATSAAICRDGIIPHMKERDYAGALLAGVDSITARVRADAVTGQGGVEGDASARGLLSQDERGGPATKPWYVIVMTVTILALAAAGTRGVFYARRHRARRCPRCGSAMHRLSEQTDDAFLSPRQGIEEKLHSVDYDVWQCACGETLPAIPYVKHFSSYKECPDCHSRTLKTTQREISAATYTSTGMAEKTQHCEACGSTHTEQVVLSQLTDTTSSSSSSGGSISSGGGGSSFGGSGSSSGGGGGSSY